MLSILTHFIFMSPLHIYTLHTAVLCGPLRSIISGIESQNHRGPGYLLHSSVNGCKFDFLTQSSAVPRNARIQSNTNRPPLQTSPLYCNEIQLTDQQRAVLHCSIPSTHTEHWNRAPAHLTLSFRIYTIVFSHKKLAKPNKQ